MKALASFGCWRCFSRSGSDEDSDCDPDGACSPLVVGRMVSAQAGKPDPAPWYIVRAGTSSAAGYHLTALAWQVSGQPRWG